MAALRRILPIVLVAAVLAAGLVWWSTRRPHAEAPRLADVVTASQTAGLVGVDALPAFARALEATFGRLPSADLKAALPIFDPAARVEALGFDPVDADGWSNIGIDADAGLGVTADARLYVEVDGHRRLVPVVLGRVADRAALLAFIEARLGAEAIVLPLAEEAGIETIRVGDGPAALLGGLGQYVAVALPSERVDLTEAPVVARFRAFLGGGGATLSQASAYENVFEGRIEGSGLYLYSGASPAAALARALWPDAKSVHEAFDFYARLFPAFAAWWGEEHGAMRLLASDGGKRLLRQCFGASTSPPVFSTFLPRVGWGATRFTLNLREVFEGLTASLPPFVPSGVKTKVGLVKRVMPFTFGVSYEEISATLTGHWVIAADLQSAARAGAEGLGAIRWLALFGLEDGERADRTLAAVLARIDQLGVDVSEVPIGDSAGHRLEWGELASVVVVRSGDMLLIGPDPEALLEALPRPEADNLLGTPAGALIDGDVAFSFAADLGPMIEFADARPELGAFDFSALDDTRFHGAIRLDDAGLLFGGPAASARNALALVLAVTFPILADLVTGP